MLPSFQGIFISTCNVDVRWFPFDIQRCELKFGSWSFDGWLLDIQMKEADVSGYMPNGEWDLLGKSCRHVVRDAEAKLKNCVAW